MSNERFSRRKFIKSSALGVSGLMLANSVPTDLLASVNSNNKARVIHIKSDKVFPEGGVIDQDLVSEMLNKAMLKLTNQNDLSDAWKTFFTADDIIAMKLNALGFSKIKGSEQTKINIKLTNSIVRSMSKANFAEKNFILFDRTDDELKEIGYMIQKNKDSLRIMGTTDSRDNGQEGYCAENEIVGEKTTRVTKIITDECTAMINIPIIKAHRLSGVTGSLKNHYGSIINANQFHKNGCSSPGIAEINNIPIIKKKQKLIICNALAAVFDRGPRWNRGLIWNEGSLILGTDPVAVDKVMLDILDAKRVKEGLTPVAKSVTFLEASEKLGLGTCKSENIELVKIYV